MLRVCVCAYFRSILSKRGFASLYLTIWLVLVFKIYRHYSLRDAASFAFKKPSSIVPCSTLEVVFSQEVDAAGEFSGDFSATALRTAWLKGAGESELSS